MKERRCELCGQGETWLGLHMSLILDHINGIPDDNRLANLRIVCPNCAATLETHCGRKNRADVAPRACLHCGGEFIPKYSGHRYCSQDCGSRSQGPRAPKPHARKVPRPSHEQLMADIESTSFVAVGRKYGVSDNAVRKWVRWYEAEGQERPRLKGRLPNAGRLTDIPPPISRETDPGVLPCPISARKGGGSLPS